MAFVAIYSRVRGHFAEPTDRFDPRKGHSVPFTIKPGRKLKRLAANIEENNALGSPYPDFAEAFPSMARSSLQKILRDMRDENKIMVIGVKRGARWYLYDEKRLFAYNQRLEAKKNEQNETIIANMPDIQADK